jgi:APA family basic amino acid/polyamine antiporter
VEAFLTIAAEQSRGGALLHILGVSFGVAVGVGMMMGSGILQAPHLIASAVPNATLIVALWVLGGVHAALGANVVAELATALPRAGGPYVYAHRALGDVGGLIVGWTNWLSNLAGVAANTVTFAAFLALLWPGAGERVALVAIALQIVLYGSNMAGLREGRLIQQATTATKCLMLLAFAVAAVVIGARHSTGQIATAAAPAIGAWAIIGAYQRIRGAYAGWEAPAYFTEENAAPSRSIPRALLLGLVLTVVLYVGVNAALLSTLGSSGLARQVQPFTTVLDLFGGPLPSVLFAFAAMVTVASCANACIMAAPRVLFALSRDKLLPRMLQTVNAGGSPSIAFLASAAFSVALAATGSFSLVFGLIGTLNSLAGLMVGISLFVLRAREPGLERPFRALLYPVLPALAVAIDGVLLALFLRADIDGAYFAVGLSLACVPFALIARYGRKDTQGG